MDTRFSEDLTRTGPRVVEMLKCSKNDLISEIFEGTYYKDESKLNDKYETLNVVNKVFFLFKIIYFKINNKKKTSTQSGISQKRNKQLALNIRYEEH